MSSNIIEITSENIACIFYKKNQDNYFLKNIKTVIY